MNYLCQETQLIPQKEAKKLLIETLFKYSDIIHCIRVELMNNPKFTKLTSTYQVKIAQCTRFQ